MASIKKNILCTVLIAVALCVMVSCDDQILMPEAEYPSIPEEYSSDEVDALITMEQVSIYSPAPSENGDPPAECDYIQFLRFKPVDTSDDAAESDAVLIMIPGVMEGANGFEYIGRMLPYIARTEYGLDMEVWAFDRRNNCLEDMTVMDIAETMTDLDAAVALFKDYYYNGAEINGKTFDGFLKGSDVPFVSEFGIKMDTEDIYTVMTTMIPDRATRKQKIFVGGHSMGGMHTSLFAGWDFDGDPLTTDDAGYNNCAGMFALDSTLGPVTGLIGPVEGLLPEESPDTTDSMTKEAYEATIELIRETPSLRLVPFLDGEVGALMEAVGYLAYNAPDEEHTAMKEIPYSTNVRTLNRLFHSTSMWDFLTGADDIEKYHYTNEALLGILFDDDFAPLAMINVSLGFLGGGPVVEKNFPMWDDLNDWGMSSVYDMLKMLFTDHQLFIADEKGDDAPLYHWVNYDQVGTDDDPVYESEDGSIIYTTTEDEVSDIKDFARAMYKGPSNLIEWYFSIRRIVDCLAVSASYGPEFGLYYYYTDMLADLPQIEFPAGDAMFGEGSGVETEYPYLEGYDHMDPMFASMNKEGNNEVIRPLIEFVSAVIEE